MTLKQTALAHALLSASSADRWMNCPASARLGEDFPDTTSPSATEGTLAHAIGELKLRKKYIEPMGPVTFKKKLAEFKKHKQYDVEMLRYTEDYLDFVDAITHRLPSPPFVEVEKRVDFSSIVPQGFGTADCIVIHGTQLWVVDFKYGKNVFVPADDNSQLKLYALGALQTYGFIYPIETVTLCVVQPRMNNLDSWETDVATLRQWGEEVAKPLAEEAFAGGGECLAGKHCIFCPVQPVCKAYSAKFALEENAIVDPQIMNAAEVGAMLTRLDGVVSYYNKLKAYALAKLLEGTAIPGFKAVEGRSTRSFKDLDAAFDRVKVAGFDEALLYERKPITLTGVEKLLGKKQFNEILATEVVKPQGPPTLVSEADGREPYKKQSAVDVFKDVKI